MARTVVSTKFQVVIPKDIREETGPRKDQTFQVISKGGVPIASLHPALRLPHA
jgi:AbrB family looped-hinge helix DNA binding protein